MSLLTFILSLIHILVFQNYALYPHITVFDNMAFGLTLRKVPKDEIKATVEEAARILDLEKLLDRKPKALSGGQRQRVAMGLSLIHIYCAGTDAARQFLVL